MYRLFYLTLAFLFFGIGVHGQNPKKIFSADSIFIYRDPKHGGTTAGLWHRHNDLDSSRATKTKLTKGDLDSFTFIFKNVKGKKLFQQKYGGELYYTVVYNGGLKSRCVIYSTPTLTILDNLDSMRRWSLKDTDDKKTIFELIRKNCP